MADVGDYLTMMSFLLMSLVHQRKALSRKREYLKDAIDKGKLGHKWTHERVDKASDEIINKMYVEYKQCGLNKKDEYTGKAPRQACY